VAVRAISRNTDPAFVGRLSLAQPAQDDALLIVLWISAGQAARPLSAHSLELQHALTAIAAIASDSEPRHLVWEVNARV
jgi:hypothetical protein